MKRAFHWKRRIKALAAILCLGLLSGCAGPKAQEVSPVQVTEKAATITCFGVVRARESQTLRLPFAVRLQGIAVREGQRVGGREPQFSIDPGQLQSARQRLETELIALESARRGYEADRAMLEAERAVCEAGAAEFDAQAVMEQLRVLATRRDSASQVKAARLSLLETLRRFDLLESYDALLAYAAAKDRFYYETANPLLEQLDQAFDRQLARVRAELEANAAQLSRTDLDILAVRERLERILRFAEAQESVRIEEDGSIALAKDGWMVDNILVAPDALVPADEPILRLIRLDSLEAACFVEEQLIRGIRVGDPVQLSLYADSTVIHLGSVAYIAQKAAERNGETMVELVVDVGEGFLPGYNVVARIAPKRSP